MMFPPVPQNGKTPKHDPESRNEHTLKSYQKYKSVAEKKRESKKDRYMNISQHEIATANLVSKTMYLEQELEH